MSTEPSDDREKGRVTDADDKTRRYARFRGPDLRADIDDEMEFHIQMIADGYAARGLSAEAARRRALAEFGDYRGARESCMHIDEARHRASRRSEVLTNLRYDVRHATRRLITNPVFAIVTVLTLAIGLGPNIAIFSIINSVVLQPLPYADADRLVYVQETFPLPGGKTGFGSVSWGNFLDWKARNRSFSDLAVAAYASSANLGNGDRPERLAVSAVGSRLFPVLGVRPMIGRNFTPEETTAGGANVVLLSANLWRRAFAGDPAIVGKSITLDAQPYTVIGIMPADITFPNRSAAIDAWLPLQVQLPPGQRGSHNYMVVGRLKPGISREAATADMKAVAGRIAEEFPDAQEGRSAAVVPLRDTVVGQVRPQLLMLLGAAALVLLIACANAASLLLARAAARRREVAVLAALGASRWRIAQQYLVESLLLSATSAVVGLVLGFAAVRGIVASAGTMLPRAREIHYDGTVIAFVAGAIVLTAILFGIAPALGATRTDLRDGLQEGTRGTSGGRSRQTFRSSLVVAQFALSLVLLAGAGLLIRTFAALLGAPTGMQPEHVLTMHLPVPVGSPKYATGDAALQRLHQPLLEQIRAMPGVLAAGYISHLPLQQYGTNGNFTIVGQSYARTADQPFAEFRAISPGYFAALGIPVLKGRDVAATDGTTDAPVAIINDVLAQQFFRDRDPVGQAISFGPVNAQNPATTIVGVVGSVRQATLDSPPLAEMYFPYTQAQWTLNNMTLVVKGDGEPTALAKSIERSIRSLDADQPVYLVRSMDDVVTASVADRRLYLRLLGAFAGIALALAMAGIFGTISYAVAQRTREFGIRLALGSDLRRLQGMVVWQGTRLVLLALLIGIPGAVAVTGLLRGVLYGVEPGDPLTLAAVSLVLAVVAVAASYLPSRRIARVDPMIAMRAE
ncbi:MAG TPA: ABC transporter permease [Gemmatimonadaceae bacterium]|nr:ABC transporter permease [Gemmatimonadaceae bacterium]